MACIPEAELERLKREVSLVRLIQSQGHELKKRGKDWVMHCVGYANKTLTYRLPAGHTQAGRQVRQQLQTLDVLRSTGHEHLNGCLVVPVLGLESGA